MQVLFVPAPLIWLRPTRVTDMKAYQHYDCPVYRTTDRRGVLATTGHSTNFLMMIKFPTLTVAPEHWVLRGEALQMQRLYERQVLLASPWAVKR